MWCVCKWNLDSLKSELLTSQTETILYDASCTREDTIDFFGTSYLTFLCVCVCVDDVASYTALIGEVQDDSSEFELLRL